MAQSTMVMAFRKRLAGNGYRNISIQKERKKDKYQVTAQEPLTGRLVKVKMTELDMHEAFRF